MTTEAGIDTWPEHLVRPYREHLKALLAALLARLELAEKRYTDLLEAADTQVEEASAKVPEWPDDPTEEQYLTVRATQVDRDLIDAQLSVPLAKAWCDVQRLRAERSDLQLRLGQVDHFMEYGIIAAGNDAELAILMLDVKEATVEQQAAESAAEFARQRLALTKRKHKEVHAALAKLRRPPRGSRT